MNSSKRAAALALFLLPLFALLAAANSAGYRFGASDQAFYVPAIYRAMDPRLYPRDAELIDSQARLTILDESVAPLARLTGIGLPALFVALQLLLLGLLAFAALRIASHLYRTWWAGVALLTALTLRHAILRTGTNTLEGYFHPRQLAFAIGACAVGSFLRKGYLLTGALVTLAVAVHPTTGGWFVMWLGIAAFAAERRWRMPLAVAGAACTALILWALSSGPLSGRLVRMDDEWLQTLTSKEYLFPLRWAASTWIVNLAYLPIVALVYRYRSRRGLLAVNERALVIGCLSLAVFFIATLPFNAQRVAFAIQLQPARVFWMLDFLATIYVIWAMAEGAAGSPARARLVAAIVIVFSLARGAYIMLVQFPDRQLVQVGLSDGAWERAMAWARSSDLRSAWLADPEHAALYGASLRVTAARDVYVEAIKDGAVGMYDRRIAMRTRDRLAALGDFHTLTPEHARALARTYDLDYLVTDRALDLPVAFTSGQIKIYRLR